MVPQGATRTVGIAFVGGLVVGGAGGNVGPEPELVIEGAVPGGAGGWKRKDGRGGLGEEGELPDEWEVPVVTLPQAVDTSRAIRRSVPS